MKHEISWAEVIWVNFWINFLIGVDAVVKGGPVL